MTLAIDAETKKAALALDWTQHKWDHDWELWDLEVDKKYWNEMTDEEKAGAMHFGYTHHTWDGSCSCLRWYLFSVTNVLYYEKRILLRFLPEKRKR